MTCTLCARKTLARGLCPTHYTEWWRENNTLTYTCAHCAAEFRPRRGKQKYCTPTCQRQHAMAQHQTAARIAKGQGLAVRIPKPAPSTPTTVIPGRWWCAGLCVVCGAPYVSAHTDRTCSDYCQASRDRDAKREHRHKRRALKRNAFVSNVVRRDVYRRDEFTCQLCSGVMQMGAVVPHPLAPTIDHIVALAAGGTHEPSNVQSAHFACNSRKGMRSMLLGVLFAVPTA